MRHFALIALLALLAIVSADKTLIVGHREPGDHLIEQKLVSAGWRLWSTEKEITIAGNDNEKITLVEIIDIKKKQTSAKPNIVAGGPERTYVTLSFVSAPRHRISYLIKVYGKRTL